MTERERILAAIEGRATERIPWVPRLDLWYRAHQLAGTLPAPFQRASLMELTAALGMGFHAVVPDFRDCACAQDDLDRALGIYNLRPMPYRTVLHGVERDVRIVGDRTHVDYRTPHGTVSTTVLYDDSMRRAGITITHVESQAFQSIEDYRPLSFIFENAEVVHDSDGYLSFAERVGDQGLAVAFLAVAASPAHHVMRDLMRLDTFYFEMHDHADEMAALLRCIGCYYEQLVDVARRCPAQAFLFGANYDSMVTYPPFFEAHILPWLRRVADVLHERDAFLLTHTDGENDGLLELYVEAGVDVADSVCPSPMTRLSLKDARDVFAGRVAIMGGIPSVSLLPSTMDDRQFEAFLDRFFAELGAGDRLILGVSDTTPPQADFGRLLKVGQRILEFGPVAGPR